MLVLSREPSNKCGSTKCPRRDRHKERGVNEVKGEKTRKNTRDLQCGRSDEKENSKRALRKDCITQRASSRTGHMFAGECTSTLSPFWSDSKFYAILSHFITPVLVFAFPRIFHCWQMSKTSSVECQYDTIHSDMATNTAGSMCRLH